MVHTHTHTAPISARGGYDNVHLEVGRPTCEMIIETLVVTVFTNCYIQNTFQLLENECLEGRIFKAYFNPSPLTI